MHVVPKLAQLLNFFASLELAIITILLQVKELAQSEETCKNLRKLAHNNQFAQVRETRLHP